MKTKLILLFIALSYSYIANAQEVNSKKAGLETRERTNSMHGNGFNYISFGAEIGPTLNGQSTLVHLALPIKVYLGRQKKGRFIIRTGIHYFQPTSPSRFLDVERSYITIIPLAIGYRKNIQNWYIEGSLGAALNTSTVVFKDSFIDNWVVTFREINYGLEVGRQLGDWDVGVAVYNTGPIPFHIMYAGIKTSYRIKW